MAEKANNPGDQPILTPPPALPKHWLEREQRLDPNVDPPYKGLLELIRMPADWFRHNIVEPNRGPKYYWYHRNFERVLPIDECYADDQACILEAELEFRRLRRVDRATVELLRVRRDTCLHYYRLESGFDFAPSAKCQGIIDSYERERTNYIIKYGELNFNQDNVIAAYMKQKHRMIIERRRALKQKLMDENPPDI